MISYLLYMDDVVSVLCKVGTYHARIRGFVSRDIIAVEDGGESRNVHGEDIDGAAGGGRGGRAHERQ